MASNIAGRVLPTEPTAALGVTQTRVVLDVIGQLASREIAVIVISHNLNDVMAVADRVAVLHLGRMAASGPISEFDRQVMVDLMTTGTSMRDPVRSGNGGGTEHEQATTVPEEQSERGQVSGN